MAGSQGTHMHSVSKDSQTQALMAEVLQGSRPSSMGKLHGGGLCGADLGQAAAPVASESIPFFSLLPLNSLWSHIFIERLLSARFPF